MANKDKPSEVSGHVCQSDDEDGTARTDGSSEGAFIGAFADTVWMYARSGCFALSCSRRYENCGTGFFRPISVQPHSSVPL